MSQHCSGLKSNFCFGRYYLHLIDTCSRNLQHCSGLKSNVCFGRYNLHLIDTCSRNLHAKTLGSIQQWPDLHAVFKHFVVIFNIQVKAHEGQAVVEAVHPSIPCSQYCHCRSAKQHTVMLYLPWLPAVCMRACRAAATVAPATRLAAGGVDGRSTMASASTSATSEFSAQHPRLSALSIVTPSSVCSGLMISILLPALLHCALNRYRHGSWWPLFYTPAIHLVYIPNMLCLHLGSSCSRMPCAPGIPFKLRCGCWFSCNVGCWLVAFC